MSMVLRSLILIALAGVGFSPLAQATDGPPSTYLGGMYSSFSGERENSLSGVDGFGLMILATPHKSRLRFVYGAALQFADGIGYFGSTRHLATMYSADAFIGFSIYPMVTAVAIRPFLEAGGLGGFKYMDVVNPPTGVDARSTGLSYGYRLAIGLETSFSAKYALRMSADYIKSTADVGGVSDYQLDTFSFGLGLCF